MLPRRIGVWFRHTSWKIQCRRRAHHTATREPDRLCQMLKSAPRRIASALKCVRARATARPDFCRHCDSHRVGATVHWARVLAWLNLGGTCAACRFLTGCKDFRSVGVRPHPAHLADRRSLRLRADAGVAAAGGGHRVRPQPGDVATQPIAEVRGPGRPLRPPATVFRSCCLDRWKPRLEGTLEFVERRIVALVNGRRVRDLVEYPRRTLSAASGAAHSIAVRMAPFGSEGFLSHGSQRPRELRWRRRFATSCPQPRIPEVCTRSPQTHTSSSGSMTIAFVRSAQPFLDRSVSTLTSTTRSTASTPRLIRSHPWRTTRSCQPIPASVEGWDDRCRE